MALDVKMMDGLIHLGPQRIRSGTYQRGRRFLLRSISLNTLVNPPFFIFKAVPKPASSVFSSPKLDTDIIDLADAHKAGFWTPWARWANVGPVLMWIKNGSGKCDLKKILRKQLF
jgi:hypothetical protein